MDTATPTANINNRTAVTVPAPRDNAALHFTIELVTITIMHSSLHVTRALQNTLSTSQSPSCSSLDATNAVASHGDTSSSYLSLERIFTWDGWLWQVVMVKSTAQLGHTPNHYSSGTQNKDSNVSDNPFDNFSAIILQLRGRLKCTHKIWNR